MKKANKIIFISVGSILGIVILLFIAGLYMLNVSLKPNDNDGKDILGSEAYMIENYPYIEPWLDSLKINSALKDTFIISDDSTKLHALYINAPKSTSKTAVLVHGYTDSAIRMLMLGYMYNKEFGYNVLLPDLYNAGLSDGDHFQMGWKDRFDVMKWMNIANNIFGDSTQMVVHGISMGAATTMMVSGEEQKDFVKCFVEDCGYTNVWDEFSYKLKSQYGLPSFPLMNISNLLCDIKYGWSFKEASALNQVANSTLPMFFIHGDADKYVPTEMVEPLYNAKKTGDKEIWVVKDAEHAVSYKENRQEYTQKVKSFVDKYIN